MRRRAAVALGGLAFGALAVALIAAPGCGGSSRFSSEGKGQAAVADAAGAAAWAGFADVGELEVVAFDDQSGVDRMVRFAVQGDPAEVDQALADAQFANPATPGIEVFETPLDGVDVATLENPRSGEDQWTNAEGRTINRKYVRGRSDEGLELIHVWAFTT